MARGYGECLDSKTDRIRRNLFAGGHLCDLDFIVMIVTGIISNHYQVQGTLVIDEYGNPRITKDGKNLIMVDGRAIGCDLVTPNPTDL